MGEERNRLAVAHQTDKAQMFGKRRDRELGRLGRDKLVVGMFTPLYEPYDEYNNVLHPKVQAQLAKMAHTKREFQQTSLMIKGEPCLNKASRMDIEVFNEKNDKMYKVPTFENCVKLSKLSGIEPPEANVDSINLFLNNLLANQDALIRLKKASPRDYCLLKIHNAVMNIRDIERWKDWRKSDWVYITLRSEIDGKMYALSHYITWMYRDFREDPVEHMTERSGIAILHQDEFLIEPTLKDIAKLFEKAIY